MMDGRKVVVLLSVVGFGLAACSRTTLSADQLLREGNENDILALDKYQGEEIVVTGRVVEKGLAPRTEFEAETHGLGVQGWGVQGRRVMKNYAFLRLVGENAARGQVLCFFEPEDRTQVGHARVGSTVHVAGMLSNLARRNSGFMAALWQCSVVK
jgi:hypothetical protein